MLHFDESLLGPRPWFPNWRDMFSRPYGDWIPNEPLSPTRTGVSRWVNQRRFIRGYGQPRIDALSSAGLIGALSYGSMVTRPRLRPDSGRLKDEFAQAEKPGASEDDYPLWHSSYMPRVPYSPYQPIFENRPDFPAYGNVSVPNWSDISSVPSRPSLPGPHDVPDPEGFLYRLPVRTVRTLQTSVSIPSYTGLNHVGAYWNGWVSIACDQLYQPFYCPYYVYTIPISWALGAAEMNIFYRKHHVMGYRVSVELSHLQNQTSTITYMQAYPTQGWADSQLLIPTNLFVSPSVSDWVSQPDSRQWIMYEGTSVLANDVSRLWSWDYSDCTKSFGREVAQDNRLDETNTGARVVPGDSKGYRIDLSLYAPNDTVMPPMNIMLEQIVMFYDPVSNVNA